METQLLTMNFFLVHMGILFLNTLDKLLTIWRSGVGSKSYTPMEKLKLPLDNVITKFNILYMSVNNH